MGLLIARRIPRLSLCFKTGRRLLLSKAYCTTRWKN